MTDDGPVTTTGELTRIVMFRTPVTPKESVAITESLYDRAATELETVSMPLLVSMLIPEIGVPKLKVFVPVPPDAVNAGEFEVIPAVVVKPAACPPPIEIAEFTIMVIFTNAVAPAESVTVTVSVYEPAATELLTRTYPF